MAAKDVGLWEKEIKLKNVSVHASLLPTGKILHWGRRSDITSRDLDSLDEHFTLPYILDYTTTESTATTNQPKDKHGNNVNLFCSGHSFRADGKLLVVGGHWQDGMGIDQACLFDPFDGQFGNWIPQAPMGRGRWYPSTVPLPDGGILVVSGAAGGNPDPNPQVFREDRWESVSPNGDIMLYPRLALDPDGDVFMSGPQANSQWLLTPVFNATTNTVGVWSDKRTTRAGQREYSPSVMYETGKVIYIGGGANNDFEPERTCQVIDLNGYQKADPKAVLPTWQPADSMAFPRKQHNATILADGTVLVTGGSAGPGFNNTDWKDKAKGLRWPVRTPELWNPNSPKGQQWKSMAEEGFDRCYHSVALLLPTGQLFSAGGGEYNKDGVVNKLEDSLTNAQIFNPPYLFNAQNQHATRPTVSNAPKDINYLDHFTVTIAATDNIPTDTKVNWIRIGSVTHCNNQSQNFLRLNAKRTNPTTLQITAPSDPKLAPPGHYMLFVFDQNNVPALAPIIHLNPKPVALPDHHVLAKHVKLEDHVPLDHKAVTEQMIADEKRPAVVLGLTPLCPYGLGPCWGGAYEALQHISDVETVRPLPNKDDSLAFVYPQHDILPDIDVWRTQFQQLAGGAYTWRGIEMTLSGVVTSTGDKLTLAGNSTRPELALAPFQQSSKLEWDLKTSAPKPMTDAEAGAYARLADAVAQHPGTSIQVTGTLQKLADGKFSLDVKGFEPVAA